MACNIVYLVCFCAVILVSLGSTAATSSILRPYGKARVDVGENYCTFHCSARTESGLPIQALPMVEWKRETENRNFLPLSHPYWYEERNIYFSYYSHLTCLEKTNSTARVPFKYYQCDFKQRNCKPDLFYGEYRCTINSEVIGEGTVTQMINFKAPSKDGGVSCFLPEPVNFSATYSMVNNTILLDWDATVRPPGSQEPYCDSSRRFEVRVRGYRNYDEFSRNPQGPTVVTEFSNTAYRRATDYTFHLARQFSRNFYYQFDVRNKRNNNLNSPTRDPVKSPLYFFSLQEKASLTYPTEKVVVMKVSVNQVVELRCEGAGIPRPRVLLLRHSIPITSAMSLVRKSLLITENDVGDYHCIASNTYVPAEGNPLLTIAHKTIRVEVEINANEGNGDMVCLPLGDTLCSTYLSARDVLFNNSNNELQTEVNRAVATLEDFKVNETLSNESSIQLLNCIDLAKAMLCHATFPFCQNRPLRSRQICKSSCDFFLPGGACGDAITPEMFPDIYEMMLSNCDARQHPAGAEPECTYVALKGHPSGSRSWCSDGDGQTYSGVQSRTVTGKKCQQWISQYPHPHLVYLAEEIYEADRECRNPGSRGERPWCYTSVASSRWEYCDVPQCKICKSYTGQFCTGLPGYNHQSLIYIDRHETRWGQSGELSAEHWLFATFHRLTHNMVLPETCEKGLRKLMCHSTLPPCSTNGTAPLRMCSDHCKLEELLHVCPNQILRRLKGQMEESHFTFIEPSCDMEESDTCLPAQLHLAMSGTLSGELCYNSTDSGESYAGMISHTRSGKTCQPWGLEWPEAEENYCRNLGRVGSMPWCFTAPDREWEYCNISACVDASTVRLSHITSTPVGLVTTEEVKSDKDTVVGLVTFFIIFGLFLILLAVGVALVVCYTYRKKKSVISGEPTLIKISGKQNWNYVLNDGYCKVSPTSPKIQEAIEGFPHYDKSSIKYIRQLGQGNFGIVFYAKAEGLFENEKETEVAVKTLKEDSSGEVLENFVREAKLMFNFDHKNIVKIYGVCMDTEPYYLIFEYMNKGDLAQFLRANASSLQRHLMNPFDGRPRSRTESTLSDEPPSLSVDQLTDICKQIAVGMDYLASKNHIHRDLACRNCLIKSCNSAQTDSGLMVKIGDFGMSQNLYSSDYYRVRGQVVLPVRWMSPEAIIYGKFTTESDVWSFGVVMWEVFSFAMQPYYGTSNEVVTESIRRHKILKKPSDCPNRLYEIMKMCWSLEPMHRPTFSELFDQLGECHLSTSSSISTSPPPSECEYSNEDWDSDAFESNSVDNGL